MFPCQSFFYYRRREIRARLRVFRQASKILSPVVVLYEHHRLKKGREAFVADAVRFAK